MVDFRFASPDLILGFQPSCVFFYLHFGSLSGGGGPVERVRSSESPGNPCFLFALILWGGCSSGRVVNLPPNQPFNGGDQDVGCTLFDPLGWRSVVHFMFCVPAGPVHFLVGKGSLWRGFPPLLVRGLEQLYSFL